MSFASTTEDNYIEERQAEHPIKLASELVVQQDWFFRQTYADALLVDIPGRYGQYQLKLNWDRQNQLLKFQCGLELDIPPQKLSHIVMSLNLLNEELTLGHLLITSQEYEVQMRYVLNLQGAGGATPAQMQEVFGLIIEQVEMASSALIQILDSDNLAPHSTRLAMMEVAGEA